MRALVVACALLSSCSWGAFLDGCEIDEPTARALAESHGVVEVFDRLDLICAPRADVAVDCRNPNAEACVPWIGSAVARARIIVSNDSDENVCALLDHEFRHVALWDRPNACASHDRECGWADVPPPVICDESGP